MKFIIGHWPQRGCNPVTQGFLKVALKNNFNIYILKPLKEACYKSFK